MDALRRLDGTGLHWADAPELECVPPLSAPRCPHRFLTAVLTALLSAGCAFDDGQTARNDAALSPDSPPPPPTAAEASEEPSADARRLLEWYRIRNEVARLRRAMDRIVVDGRDDDWGAFYWSSAPMKRHGRECGAELQVAIAPSDTRVLFCLRFEKDSGGRFDQREDISLSLSVSGVGVEEEVEVCLRPGFDFAWQVRRDESVRVAVPKGTVSWSTGERIEGSMDLSQMCSAAPVLLSPDWLDPVARPWIRVGVSLSTTSAAATDETRSQRVDLWGPEVASYRLVPDRFRPKWSESVEGTRSVARCPFFFGGKWIVTAQPYAWPNHLAKVAYDLSINDARGSPYAGDDERRKEDSYAWNAELFAPSDGTVESVQNEGRDREPAAVTGEDPRRPPRTVEERGNEIVVVGERFGWVLHHLRNGSIPKAVGQNVRQGEFVGNVGNSGRTPGPHLHFEAFEPGTRKGLPLVLQDVAVGLNSDPHDPWGVRLPEWEVESGYFVRRLEGGR